jgi:WD40 repeat protein
MSHTQVDRYCSHLSVVVLSVNFHNCAGYTHTAFVFGNESLAKDTQVVPGEFAPSSLVDVVQKGIRFKELQARAAANGTKLRSFSSAELLRARNPDDLVKKSGPNRELSPTSGQRLAGHTAHVLSLAWHPTESCLASASADFTVRIHHLSQNVQPGASCLCDVLRHHVPSSNGRCDVASVAWSPDGSQLASATLDGMLRIWNRNGRFREVVCKLVPILTPLHCHSGYHTLREEMSVILPLVAP